MCNLYQTGKEGRIVLYLWFSKSLQGRGFEGKRERRSGSIEAISSIMHDLTGTVDSRVVSIQSSG